MKRIACWMVTLAIAASTGLVAPEGVDVPHLTTRGNQIVTAGGQPVVLRGVNVMRSEWELSIAWERRAIPDFATNWHGNLIERGYSVQAVVDPDYVYAPGWATVTSTLR